VRSPRHNPLAGSSPYPVLEVKGHAREAAPAAPLTSRTGYGLLADMGFMDRSARHARIWCVSLVFPMFCRGVMVGERRADNGDLIVWFCGEGGGQLQNPNHALGRWFNANVNSIIWQKVAGEIERNSR
jgi:hypothetical protein